MRTIPAPAPSNPHDRRRNNRAAVWALVIVALVLLTLAAGLRASAENRPGRATRTQSYNASGDLKSLSVENVNGSVEITPGAVFKADVTLSVDASTDAAAKKILDETKTSFENESGELSLYTEEPGVSIRRSGHGWNVRSHRDDDWRVEVQYRITVPPGLAVSASSVNGPVTVRGATGTVDLSTVNGRIEIAGARRDAKLNTVNGSIDATFADLPRGANVDARSVNGAILLRLPANAAFRFEGRTMSGQILSTFALPVANDDALREKDEARAARDRARAERDRIKAEIREKKRQARKSEDGDDDPVDLSELNEAMADLNREMAELSQELAREITVNLNRAYEGTVGNGGAFVHCSNLNGRILVLAEGTTESQAKKLTSERHAFSSTAPRAPRAVPAPVPAPAPHAAVAPVAPVSPMSPMPPMSPMAMDPWGRSITKGDVEGDLVLSFAPSDVTVGKVSGRVKISTQSGQIVVRAAAKGADLSSAGGDIRVEAVTGDLKATTSGGDVRAGAVSGDVRIETAGGDVIVHSAGGSVAARTGGGDITLKKVHGPVVARTSGGTVSCEITSAAAPGGELFTSGGDVTVTLPSNYRADIDARVSGGEPDSESITSQFPDVVITRRPGSISGEGKLNGGGPKLVIRSTSGSVSIRKGPAA